MVRIVNMVTILIMMTSVYAIAAVIKANGGEMHTILKLIELESPGYLQK